MPAANRRPLDSEEPLVAPPVAPLPSSPAGAEQAQRQQAQQQAQAQQQQQAQPPFRQPCTLKGAASAAYAGALGYFIGVVPAAIRFKGRQWGAIHGQGVASARQLALMSGMYTAVHCICQRIRMVEDAWNRGIAGCSTGLVLGWSGGPWAALQSCAGLGLISALIDLGGGAVEAAEAAVLQPLQQAAQQAQQRQQARRQSRAAAAGAPAGPSRAPHRASPQQPADLLAALLRLPASGAHSPRAGDGSGVPAPAQLQQLLQPAAAAMQQALAAAPPLMFLGACCSGAATAGVPDACELRRGRRGDRPS